jgi:hypothetical protein
VFDRAVVCRDSRPDAIVPKTCPQGTQNRRIVSTSSHSGCSLPSINGYCFPQWSQIMPRRAPQMAGFLLPRWNLFMGCTSSSTCRHA